MEWTNGIQWIRYQHTMVMDKLEAKLIRCDELLLLSIVVIINVVNG
jgi:hypothetical protein